MAFILNNLLSSLDSSIGSLDSSSDLLEIVQALNVTNPTRGYGNSQKKTYDTFASLPPPSPDFRGTIAVVKSAESIFTSANIEDVENGLYLCDGSQWSIIEELDSAAPILFQGRNFGYTSGGGSNIIDKFPFASDANATDVGDLTTSTHNNSTGQSSGVSGYTSGTYPVIAIISKFPFVADTNATSVGDLSVARRQAAGQSTIAFGYGYTSGGAPPAPGLNIIDKFPFASDANATDVGDLTVVGAGWSGQSSTVSGYSSRRDQINKFPFASDGNATDVGDLSVFKFETAGQSSAVSGYTSGGRLDGARFNVIDKFPFASDGNATDVGDLTLTRNSPAGQSSEAFGYSSGGSAPPNQSVIDKFSFVSDGNAANVGSLTRGLSGGAGQQF